MDFNGLMLLRIQLIIHTLTNVLINRILHLIIDVLHLLDIRLYLRQIRLEVDWHRHILLQTKLR